MATHAPVYAPTETLLGAPLFSADNNHFVPHHRASHHMNMHQHMPYAASTAMMGQPVVADMAVPRVTVGAAGVVPPPPAAAMQQLAPNQQLMLQQLNAMHLQQQQHAMMMGAAGPNTPLMMQQLMMMSGAALPVASHHHGLTPFGAVSSHGSHKRQSPPNTAAPSPTEHANNNGGRRNISPNNNNNNGGTTRGPSTPFNPAAAMPLEDMIVAYNNVKAREIELQGQYAAEVAAAAALGAVVASFVSPFVDYACSQQGKLVLQGLLHFEEEVAVAQDLFTSIGDHMEHIALNEHGCHVIRALGEKIGNAAAVVENEDGTLNEAAALAANEASLIKFISAFNETLFLNICTLSQESRRIPQALFETYNATKPELFAPLVDIVSRNVLYLSATQQGCIAFMRIYEASNFTQKRQMAANLVRIIADLSCDSFGNYVVQCLVEHSEVHVAAQYVSTAFVGQCVRLACNKFASNVLEKVVRKLSHIPTVRRIILDELLFDATNATICCEDSFANFVVQTLIETSNNAAEFRKIHDRVKAAIVNSTYAAKIEARLRTKSVFATSSAAGNHNANSANNSPAPAVTVGSANADSTGNAPAMMAGATVHMQNGKNNTSTPSPLSSSVANMSVNTSAGPVYNVTTAPSTPHAGPAANSNLVAPTTTTSKRGMGYQQSRNNNNNTLPADSAIVNGQQQQSSNTKRNPASHHNDRDAADGSQGRNNARRHNNNKFTTSNSTRSSLESDSNKDNKENATGVVGNNKPVAAPTSGPTSSSKPHDPLQAEAKRLLNSDQPPSTFTPYKPSPFHDRSNKQHGNNASGKQHHHANNNANGAAEKQQHSNARMTRRRGDSHQEGTGSDQQHSSPRSSQRSSPQNNSASRRGGYYGRQQQQAAAH